MRIKSLGQKQKTINDLCIYLNRFINLSDFGMLEIDPENSVFTHVFCQWFKTVVCVREIDDDESKFMDFFLAIHDYNNVKIINNKPEKSIHVFNSEIIPFVFIHNNTERSVFDWSEKVIQNGYIGGDDYKKLPGFVKPDKIFLKKYWVSVRS